MEALIEIIGELIIVTVELVMGWFDKSKKRKY